MAIIERVEIWLVDLKPMVTRSDAIQSFTSQETPIVKITDSDGGEGVGYTYTIGTGGTAVHALLKDYLIPRLIGREASMIEEIWKDLFFFTHATSVGAITSLSLAAIDTALWDLKAKRSGLPLHQLAGGAQSKVPLYTTEGGWLHLTIEELIDDALLVKEQGFGGSKIKVGRPVKEDLNRLQAVKEAVGDRFEIMIDANQGFTVDEAIRRAPYYSEAGVAWYEEPLPAEDIQGHVRLVRSTSLPIAVGESLYHPSHFRDYMARDACSIIQADVARIGGITPWLKTAHTAESFNLPVCPHFLMELHVALTAAVPNGKWVEYIPQLGPITERSMTISDGYAIPSSDPGLGIDWDWDAIKGYTIDGSCQEFV